MSFLIGLFSRRLSQVKGMHLILIFAFVGISLFLAPDLLSAEDGHHGPEVQTSDGKPLQESPLQIFTNLLIWEYIAFALLFLVLAKVAFPKMFAAMSKRQERIEGALEKAERVRKEADSLLERHEKMMAEAHAQAKKISDEASAAAESSRAQTLQAAQEEAAQIVGRAKREIQLYQEKAMDELRKHAVDLSLSASAMLLERSLEDDDHKRLAHEAVEKALAHYS